jgi:hypothetical protein
LSLFADGRTKRARLFLETWFGGFDMLKRGLLGALVVINSSAAYARCWNECVLPNPVGGSCGRYVRVCDLEDPAAAVASFEQDVRQAVSRMTVEWHRTWGEVPAPLRQVLEQYPVAILAAVYPETRAYALAIAAIEQYAARAIRRNNEAQEIAAQAPEWKQKQLNDGQAVLLLLEGRDTSNADYPRELPPDLSKYDMPWRRFLVCMDAAQDYLAGKSCVDGLTRQALLISTGS